MRQRGFTEKERGLFEWQGVVSDREEFTLTDWQMRIASWNPMSLADRDRELEIQCAFNSVDIVIVIGRTRKCP